MDHDDDDAATTVDAIIKPRSTAARLCCAVEPNFHLLLPRVAASSLCIVTLCRGGRQHHVVAAVVRVRLLCDAKGFVAWRRRRCRRPPLPLVFVLRNSRVSLQMSSFEWLARMQMMGKELENCALECVSFGFIIRWRAQSNSYYTHI